MTRILPVTDLLDKVSFAEDVVAHIARKEDEEMMKHGKPETIMPRLRKAVMLIEKGEHDDDDGKINNKFRAVISTSDVDRDGDIIDIAGWKLKNFNKNPVLLFAHDSRRIIGGVDLVEPKGNKLMSDFHVNTDIPLGLEVATLLNAKDLRATSVGLDPIKMHSIMQGKEEGCATCIAHRGPMRSGFFRQSVHMTEQELIELSIVAIPANVGALVRMKDAASRLTLGDGMMELLDVDVTDLTLSRLESLERRIDALCAQAGDVKVPKKEETATEGGDLLFSAAVAHENIRRALRRS